MIAIIARAITAYCVFILICGRAIADNWTSLLLANDQLTNWSIVDGTPNKWSLDNGILVCNGVGGDLMTKRMYRDFELELEFRVQANGNSGVFLRVPSMSKEPSYEGMEIQILDDFSPEHLHLRPSQYEGSLYDVEPAKSGASGKAGEWQKMTIFLHKTNLRVTLNGIIVIDTNLKNHEASFEKHPGLKRDEGYLGLQNYGQPVEFRNIRIRELP